MTFLKRLPKGSKRIVVMVGQTFQGRIHFEEVAYDVSAQYADYQIASGIARLHESQK